MLSYGTLALEVAVAVSPQQRLGLAPNPLHPSARRLGGGEAGGLSGPGLHAVDIACLMTGPAHGGREAALDRVGRRGRRTWCGGRANIVGCNAAPDAPAENAADDRILGGRLSDCIGPGW